VFQRPCGQPLTAGEDTSYPLTLMVSKLNRIVGMAALQHARSHEIRNRRTGSWITIRYYQTLSVMSANHIRRSLGQMRVRSGMTLEKVGAKEIFRLNRAVLLQLCQFSLAGQGEGLVYKVEAKFFAGDRLVAICKEGPLVNESIERVRVGEHIRLFLRDCNARQLFVHRVENAKARRAVKANIHMNSVFFSQPDGSIDRLDLLLVDGKQIGSGPEAVIHGQAYPVEPPVANPAKVILSEHPVVFIRKIFHPVRIGGKIFEKVKAVPARILCSRCRRR